MPAVRRSRPWNQKPEQAYVNWGHPLAQGLVACVPFTEGGGPPTELVTGKPLTLSGSAPTWGANQLGSDLIAVFNSTYWTLAGFPKTYTSFTLVFVGITNKDSGDSGRIINTSTDGNGISLCSNSEQSGGTFTALYGNVSWCNPASAITVPSTTPVFLAVSGPSGSGTVQFFTLLRHRGGNDQHGHGIECIDRQWIDWHQWVSRQHTIRSEHI